MKNTTGAWMRQAFGDLVAFVCFVTKRLKIGTNLDLQSGQPAALWGVLTP